jgi:hypothetical protein
VADRLDQLLTASIFARSYRPRRSVFVCDAKHQEYELKLAGIYKPGNYKLLVNSNLLPEQCAVFQVTGGN